jgi:hypothetical protein
MVHEGSGFYIQPQGLRHETIINLSSVVSTLKKDLPTPVFSLPMTGVSPWNQKTEGGQVKKVREKSLKTLLIIRVILW